MYLLDSKKESCLIFCLAFCSWELILALTLLAHNYEKMLQIYERILLRSATKMFEADTAD